MANTLIALALIPAILAPAAFVWYLNVAGIRALLRTTRRAPAATR